MTIWQIGGFSIVAGMLALLVGRQQRELGLIVSLGAGTMLLLWALPQVASVKSTLERVAALGGLNQGYLQTTLKALLIACVSEFAAQTCQDMGEGGLALKIGFCGKLMILALSAPILYGVVELIIGLLP